MLRDMMESILKNSDTVLGVEWKSGPNSSELLLEQEDGRGRMVFHPLFPGVTLAFIQVSAKLAGVRGKCRAAAPADQLLRCRKK